MATAQNVINLAGSLLRIVASPGAAVDATTSADMLVHLQGLIGVWSEKALVEIPPPSAVGTTMSESPGVLDAVSYGLAVRYGEAVGKQVSPTLYREATDLESWLGGRKTTRMEQSLTADGMPAVSRGRYNISSDS